jgi:CheY-like chemotaxis protein
MSERRCRVLVADDDAMNRLVAEESLKYLGADSVAVETGAQVLQALAEQRFDLLLLDVHMPDMSGIEAAARVREHERLHGSPRLPILALTASATVKDQQSCIDAGMDGVLTKPFRIEQLGELLRRWCPGDSPDAPPRAGGAPPH